MGVQPDFMFGCIFIFLTWIPNICFLYLFSFPSILQYIRATPTGVAIRGVIPITAKMTPQQ